MENKKDHSFTGKCLDNSIPKSGWTCVHIEDLGEDCVSQEDSIDLITCEMCQLAYIRFVHLMHHPNIN